MGWIITVEVIWHYFDFIKISLTLRQRRFSNHVEKQENNPLRDERNNILTKVKVTPSRKRGSYRSGRSGAGLGGSSAPVTFAFAIAKIFAFYPHSHPNTLYFNALSGCGFKRALAVFFIWDLVF